MYCMPQAPRAYVTEIFPVPHVVDSQVRFACLTERITMYTGVTKA